MALTLGWPRRRRGGPEPSAHLEARRAGRLGLVDLDGGDPRRRGTLAAPGDHPLHRGRVALEARLDPAVGQVAHPPGDSLGLGTLGAGRPEEHALHPAGDEHPPGDHASAASSVMSVPASATLTGQLSLASDAASMKSLELMPGTRPRTTRWMPVMPSPGWKVTCAVVSSASGGLPALARPFDSAIEKHDECAAAMSSS